MKNVAYVFLMMSFVFFVPANAMKLRSATYKQKKYTVDTGRIKKLGKVEAQKSQKKPQKNSGNEITHSRVWKWNFVSFDDGGSTVIKRTNVSRHAIATTKNFQQNYTPTFLADGGKALDKVPALSFVPYIAVENKQDRFTILAQKAHSTALAVG